VNFYSPNVKKYIAKTESTSEEEEYFSQPPHQYFLNAAVKLSINDPETGKQLAQDSIERALDVLRCFYKPRTRFELKVERYIVCDVQGNEVGMGFSRPPNAPDWYEALDFDIYKLRKDLTPDLETNIYQLLSDPSVEKSEIIKKINYSLHWYRKAEETNNLEDKVLNYWIVLENLLNFEQTKGNLISNPKIKETKLLWATEFLPPIELKKFFYDVGWELYWYLNSLILSQRGGRHFLELPLGLAEKCNLNAPAGSEINCSKLIDNLDILASSIDRKIIKDKVIYTKAFYEDNVFAKKEIEKFTKRIRNDLMLIYRYRNKIVHNAHYDNTVLPFYVEKIRSYSGNLLREIIVRHLTDKIPTIEEILVRNHTKIGLILKKLEKNIPIDFLKLEL
jgi:hypothetical protein